MSEFTEDENGNVIDAIDRFGGEPKPMAELHLPPGVQTVEQAPPPVVEDDEPTWAPDFDPAEDLSAPLEGYVPAEEPQEQQLSVIEQLQNANAAAIQGLMAMGADLPTLGILKIRIDLLAKFVLGEPVLEQFELMFEANVANLLQAVAEGHRRQLLTKGVTH